MKTDRDDKEPSIETQRLVLFPHKVEPDVNGEWKIIPHGREGFTLPADFQSYYQMIMRGLSLAQIADSMKNIKIERRFSHLSRFIVFLAERELLVEGKAIQLAELLRSDYSWKQSIAFEEISSIELFRFSSGKTATELVKWVTALVVAAFGLHFLWIFVLEVSSGADSFSVITNAWPLLIAFIFTFFVGRSALSIVQFLTMRILAGYGAGLKIRFDTVSFSLGTDEISIARGPAIFIKTMLFSLLWLFAPVAVYRFFDLGAAEGFIPAFTALLFLSESSPFRKSEMTEWLKSLYNFENSDNSDNSDSLQKSGHVHGAEEEVKLLHYFGLFAWTILLALWIAFPGTALWKHFNTYISLSNKEVWISSGLLFFLMAFIFVSFLDDIVDGVKSGLSDRPSRVRKIWRQRAPELPVTEAVQRGKIPSLEELEKLPLLRQIEPKIRAALLKESKILDLALGAAVCSQGEKDRRLFILLSGKLAVAKRSKTGKKRVVAILGPGSVFGEVAFFFGQPRTADVIATEDARVLSISHEMGMGQISNDKSEELQLRIWFLQALVTKAQDGFLRTLPGEVLDSLIHSGKKTTILAGQKLFSEGERADACYFIVQGRASIVQNTKLINRVQAGDVLGEISLLMPNSLRTATVIADSDLLLIKIENDYFWSLMCSHLPLAIEIERLAALRLHKDHLRLEQKSS